MVITTAGFCSNLMCIPFGIDGAKNNKMVMADTEIELDSTINNMHSHDWSLPNQGEDEQFQK